MKKYLNLRFFVVMSLIVFALLSAWTHFAPSKENELLFPEKNFPYPEGFVKDPGKAGRQDLAGIDSDHDGVRDDLQRFIYARYPHDPAKRGALKQLAMFYQDILNVDPTNKNEISKLDLKFYKVCDCLYYHFNNGENDDDEDLEEDLMKVKAINTKERTVRYFYITGIMAERENPEGTRYVSDMKRKYQDGCLYDSY